MRSLTHGVTDTPTDELHTLLASLTPQAQAALIAIIQTAQPATPILSSEYADFAFIHHYLKADPAHFEDAVEYGSADQEDDEDLVIAQEQASELEESVSLFKAYPDFPSIALPPACASLDRSLSAVLTTRASCYTYSDEPISLSDVSNLLYWTAGVKGYVELPDSERFPLRLAPSAGALQSVNLYVIAHRVASLAPGVYYYHPAEHALKTVVPGDEHAALSRCCMQEFVTDAPMICVLTCSIDRVQWRYGIRAYRSVHLDAGVMCENLYLVGTALNLGVCAIFGFFEDRLQQVLRIDDDREFPALLFTVGHHQVAEDPDEERGNQT